MLETVEYETGPEPRWTVIWLHGLGADGHDFVPVMPELIKPEWPELRFVFPHAPMRPVTINNGARMRAWYDIAALDMSNRADSAGVDQSVQQVEALIEREGERGILANRVLLAGFSQGGAIALTTGLRRNEPLAGLIGLSTYLPGGAQAVGNVSKTALGQPVFMAHGNSDPVIAPVHAEQSMQVLRSVGFEVEWHRYPMEHQVSLDEIQDLGQWMSRRFIDA
ncbi:MAG: alpha/beta hydrolase [Xanthomonadaceae bacterium]|jgi:phospholipase/carboxylesterase|nr:alpha/beta hydrolase [Xanthomonadaceae bacterium]